MSPKQTPKHPRAIADWTDYTPRAIGRSVAERQQWEAAIREEARDLARLTCDACGHRGLALFARFRRDTGAYEPLVYCAGCGATVAF